MPQYLLLADKENGYLYADLKKGKNTVVLSNDNSENFNGKSTSAPYIFNIKVNPLFSEPDCITNTYNKKG